MGPGVNFHVSFVWSTCIAQNMCGRELLTHFFWVQWTSRLCDLRQQIKYVPQGNPFISFNNNPALSFISPCANIPYSISTPMHSYILRNIKIKVTEFFNLQVIWISLHLPHASRVLITIFYLHDTFRVRYKDNTCYITIP